MTTLGVDLGTSGVKALSLDASGQVVGRGSAGYPVAAPRAGWAETDPEDWWRAVVAAVRTAVAGRRVTAIGLSGQMHGVVLASAAGAPLRPALLWPDRRASLRPYRALPAGLRERLANPLFPGMAGPMLCWLARHEPAAYGRARWALAPKDWLRMRLTGRAAAEPSDASATLLYDVPADGWAYGVVEALGLRADLLPDLVPSAAVAGALTGAAAADLGLLPGIPVVAGAADAAAGIVGTGLTDPGEVQLTVGTGGQLVTLLGPDPAPDPELRTHRYRAATGRGWYALAATLNAGLALDWVRDLLGLSWAELYAAGPARPGDPVFVPYLAGERTPVMDAGARAHWVDLASDHDRAALARAAVEGVCFALADALEALPASTGPLRLAGGGSTDPAFRQVLADVLGRPLRAVDVPDASARGAALLATPVRAPAPEPVLVAEPAADVSARRARFRKVAQSAS
ncbi:MAG: xylulokinase [Mycobacteriales bacterium]